MGQMKMVSVPNWELDPIEVICAPVSALLITRISPWYTIKSIEQKVGLQKKKPASKRLRDSAAVAKCRAKSKTKK